MGMVSSSTCVPAIARLPPVYSVRARHCPPPAFCLNMPMQPVPYVTYLQHWGATAIAANVLHHDAQDVAVLDVARLSVAANLDQADGRGTVRRRRQQRAAGQRVDTYTYCQHLTHVCV